MRRVLSKEELNRAIIILWTLWNTRNLSNQNQKIPDFKQTCNTINKYIGEPKEELDSYSKLPQPKNHSSHLIWKLSDPDSWKLNTDASWCEALGKGGLGWVIRDSNGSLIGAGYKQTNRKWPIKCMEAEAILNGIKEYLSSDEGEEKRFKLVVEDLSELACFVEEIGRISEAQQIEFVKCPRSSNSLAHGLARAAISHGDFYYFFGCSLPIVEEEEAFWWEIVFPDWLVKIVSDNIGVPNT